jgi:hypothetical protein
VVVFGTSTGDVQAGATSFTLNVTGGNHFAKLLFGKTTLSVGTDGSTKVNTSNGSASTLAAIDTNDRLLVMYKACKSTITTKKGSTALTVDTLKTTLEGLKAKKVVDRGQGNGQD